VERLGAAHPDLAWYAPLGHAAWLRARGIRNAHDVDWWGEERVGATVRLTAVPAQHWTQRTSGTRNRRLWCAWSIRDADGSGTFFGGDSGWFEGYHEIGERIGPHDVSILPIGAYAPRWFMRPFHMTPEEAVDAWQALGAKGSFIPMHWGTFILSDEPVLEPPARLRAEWHRRGLSASDLHVPAHGGTVVIRPRDAR
jgi:N-acyl-phosphatidylethanolamine-hydrolysing phospholipase D